MILREKFLFLENENQEITIDTADIKQIYLKLQNNYSRKIFENRFMYALTGDYRYIGNIIANTDTGKKIGQMLDTLGSICIYGAGIRGKLLVEMFPDKKWNGFIDLNKNGFYEDYIICSIKQFQYEPGTTILISNYDRNEAKEILCELTENRKVPRENIVVLNDYIENISDNIYIDPKYIGNISMKNKVFMDLGCFDGKDSIRAIEYFTDDSMDVYAFEPDQTNYMNCVNNLQPFTDRIYLQKKGVGCRKETGYFTEGGAGARFCEQGESLVEIDTIDHAAEDQNVGFIKMDIEGYEEAAIIGGAKTIKRCSPVLAICVYHKKSDIWKIPLKILEINPNYKFYLEHYTFGWSDTVLYAVV